jgi:hypothetical protein
MDQYHVENGFDNSQLRRPFGRREEWHSTAERYCSVCMLSFFREMVSDSILISVEGIWTLTRSSLLHGEARKEMTPTHAFMR